MSDFTSALYLGFVHASASLAPWDALTLGRPAALEEPVGARALAGELSELIGGQAGLLYPSTLHLFRDLFQTAAPRGTVIVFDAASYPIARWGAESASVKGVAIETVPHRDLVAFDRRVRQARREGQQPLIVTDGLCPSCGRLAPLPALASLAADAGGLLVIDDTQAIGVLGRDPSPKAPLGIGGGGTVAWHGLRAENALVGASLAKAFGAPLAVLNGPAAILKRIESEGETRVHTSPPSSADISAGRSAVALNRAQGDQRRSRLVRLVSQLRKELAKLDLQGLSDLPIPMQAIAMPSLRAARAALKALDENGVRALVTRSCRGNSPTLTLLITARHTSADICRAATALARATGSSLSFNLADRSHHEHDRGNIRI